MFRLIVAAALFAGCAADPSPYTARSVQLGPDTHRLEVTGPAGPDLTAAWEAAALTLCGGPYEATERQPHAGVAHLAGERPGPVSAGLSGRVTCRR